MTIFNDGNDRENGSPEGVAKMLDELTCCASATYGQKQDWLDVALECV